MGLRFGKSEGSELCLKNPWYFYKNAITEFVDLIYYHNNKSVLSNKLNWKMIENRIKTTTDYELYKGSQILAVHRFFQRPKVKTGDISPLNGCDEKALRDLLTYCQDNDIQIILIGSLFEFDEKDAKEFNMNEKITDEYNIPFLNTNYHLDEIDFDYSMDFCDYQHANIFGMEEYTCYVADYLKEHYAISDQHDDAPTSEWNELYTSYEEDAKNLKSRVLTTVENKMQAIMDESVMRMISDAGEWLSLADNGNMTVLVLMDQSSEFTPSSTNGQLLKDYGLTISVLEEEDHYFCVYSGKIVSSSTSKSFLSGEFGSKLKNKLEYSLSVGEETQICIADQNYIEGVQRGIHMVVFDNNTYDFVDSVNITISADGELHLEHNPEI